MTKITLNNVATFQNDSSAVATTSANNAVIVAAMDNTLSRDGTSPNQMGASLDMNNHTIINLPDATSNQNPATLNQLNNAIITKGAVPLAGTTGQVLTKNSNTDLDTKWATATVTIPNLTGVITSVGSATSTGSQTGTGSKFVMDTSPTIVTPTLNSPVLVTPALGTPASGVATNLTGTAAGLTAGAVTTNANLTGPITSSGNATSVAAQTGSGSTFVMQTTPTLTTPVLGVATATSINKMVITAPATTSTLAVANNKTATINNTLTLSGTDGSTLNIGAGGTITGSSASAIYYDNIPQNSQSVAYTTVLADAQKHIFHPSGDTTARIYTIDSNANVAYPIGTSITFVNQHGAGTITIAISGDSMFLAGSGSTGSRTLAANGIATAMKVASTEWIISGPGLT